MNAGDGSNSCWAEMEQFVIGTYPMFPLTIDMQQRLILHYLQPMGEYQEVTWVERLEIINLMTVMMLWILQCFTIVGWVTFATTFRIESNLE